MTKRSPINAPNILVNVMLLAALQHALNDMPRLLNKLGGTVLDDYCLRPVVGQKRDWTRTSISRMIGPGVTEMYFSEDLILLIDPEGCTIPSSKERENGVGIS